MKTATIVFFGLMVGASALRSTAVAAESASYSITSDSLDAGGGNSATESYAGTASIGGLGGISTDNLGDRIANQGYIGQLYEITNLVVRADSPVLNEGETKPLQAEAWLDDGTLLGLSGSSAAWSVLTGPIDSIDANGSARAGFVYENTPATVRVDYQERFATVDLMVLNVGNDDFGAYAADGLDDAWQVHHFGKDNPNAGPDSDPDGDGQSNRFEYVAGTDPTDANSRFRFAISNVAGQPTQKSLVFGPRIPTRTYTIQFRDDATTGGFNDLVIATSSDSGVHRAVVDPNATNATRFYRVQISYP